MSNPLIEIMNSSVCLSGRQVLFDLDWRMKANENWAILGNNGAGKTTLMKLIFGELIPLFGGEVRWFGQKDRPPLWEVRKNIGYVSAEYQEHYEPNILGWQVVASGLFSSIGLYQEISGSQKDRAMAWMDFLGISRLAEIRFHRMSYGESRRVLLGRSLVNRPRLLILDEPCSGLDIPTRELFLETLEKLVVTKTRILYVTHHIDEILPFITHVLLLKEGRVFGQGTKKVMLKDKKLSDTLDAQITLQQNQGRYWITSCRVRKRRRHP
ncbi:MAG: ABC transporter [Nitrospinae bacterium CG11_big_fil_rev_8_21_14_0_20_56_8]|nr:MAG: ABC transporter [Nitrospinae bacterium CG11_big_fil_rev_8_21_14_0_20_56_8]